MSMRFVLVTGLACAVLLLAETDAHAQYGQAAPVRQIHIQADAYGRAALDYRGRRGLFMPDPWHTIPGSIPADSGMHTVTVRSTGFESVRIPIPQGSNDLLLDVRMSRPTFEAGIALTVLGGAVFIAGLALLIHGAVDAAEAWNEGVDAGETDPGHACQQYSSRNDNCWDQQWEIAGWPTFSVGAAVLIPGILMMVLDHQRDTTYTIANQ